MIAGLPRAAFGRPLGWTRGWTMVVAVWVVCACFLGAARLQMGHLAALDAREVAAVAAVRQARMGGGPRYGDLLRLLAGPYAGRLLGARHERHTARWYAFDRPWEHRVYVVWQLGDTVALDFTVQGGAVQADAGARLMLKTVSRMTAAPR